MADQLFPNGRWKPVDVGLVVLQALLIAVATLVVSLRLYARISLRKRLALDDLCIVIGLCLAIARAVVASLSSQSGWASRKGPDHAYQIDYYTHYFERRLFYALSAFFIRAGVLLYYLRLFPHSLCYLRRGSWILLFFSLAQCVQLSVELAVYCDDMLDLYHGHFETYNNPRCANAYAFTYSGAIGDAAIDAAIYILPLPYVWGLKKLKLEQRLGLVFVFGIGIIACLFALLQIPFIMMNYRYNEETGESWFGTQVSTFIAIELCLGLTAASLPDLRGLISRVKPGFMAAFRHMDDSSSGGQATDSRDRDEVQNAERRDDTVNRQVHVISIRGGIRVGGEYGVGRKVKRPDWLRSNNTGSLFEDTRITASRITASRETSRSRGPAASSAASVEHGDAVVVAQQGLRPGRPSIVPELRECEGEGKGCEKFETRADSEEMEKSLSEKG